MQNYNKICGTDKFVLKEHRLLFVQCVRRPHYLLLLVGAVLF
jgi:hypothetical protein